MGGRTCEVTVGRLKPWLEPKKKMSIWSTRRAETGLGRKNTLFWMEIIKGTGG